MANPPYDTKSLTFLAASSKYASAGVAANLNRESNQALSGTVWYKSQSISPQAIVGNLGASTALLGWAWYTDINGYQYFRACNNVGALNYLEARTGIATTNTAAKGGWSMLAFTYTGSGNVAGISFYQNGVGPLIKTTVRDTLVSTSVSTTATEIGAWFTGGNTNYNDGSLCHLALWDKALSVAEVREIFNNGRPGDLSTASVWGNNLAWWSLGTGDDPTIAGGLIDHGPNGYDATGTNFVGGDIATDAPGMPVYNADIVTLQQATGVYYQMEANDSVTGTAYSWVLPFKDFAGLGYPGPNSAVSIRVSVIGPG